MSVIAMKWWSYRRWIFLYNFFFYKTNFHLFYCFVATTLPNKLAIRRLRVATNSDKVTTEIRKPPVGEVYNVLERLYWGLFWVRRRFRIKCGMRIGGCGISCFFSFDLAQKKSFSYAENKVFLTGKGCFLAKNTFCSSLEHTLFLAGVHPFPRRAKNVTSP